MTIADVARAAGVQPSTVSKALNNARGSAEVRRRVELAASELGYRPSQQARSLRQDETRSIGLLIPDLANPTFLPLLRGVERAARERGYVVLIADGQRSAEVQTEALERFFSQHVDGLVLAGPAPAEALRLHLQHGVRISPRLSDRERFATTWEQAETAATKVMARRLLDLGHRRFTYVTTPLAPGRNRYRRGRLGALRETLAAARAEIEVIEVDPDDGIEAARRSLRAEFDETRPTAIVCATHLLGPWILLAAADAGLELPTDVSIVLYGDSDWARAHLPALSVVARDTFTLGYNLATGLLDDLAGSHSAPPIDVPAEYIERSSVAALTDRLLHERHPGGRTPMR